MNQETNNDNHSQGQRIAYLVAAYVNHTITEAEHDELNAWVEESEANMRLFEELTDEQNIRNNLQLMSGIRTEQKLQEIKQKAGFAAKTRSYTGILALTGVAAAIIAIAIQFWHKSTVPAGTQNSLAAANKALSPAVPLIQLELSDGRKVDLSKAGNGYVETDMAVRIQNKTGMLQYHQVAANHVAALNRLSTGKAATYALQLSDGTKVWLNAMSSLQYPLSFNGNERSVQLQGEAYFEVAHNAAKPFVVNLPGSHSVKVLGTAFNINSYSAEEAQDITVTTGKVQLQQPGQQALLIAGRSGRMLKGKSIQVQAADTATALAWRQNRFVFKDQPVAAIMQQISRWYNVEVVYETANHHLFNANISRGENLSKLLSLLEMTGKIGFRTENNRIYVIR